MPMKFSTIAFDADDTLWENEALFRLSQERFTALLSPYTEPAYLAARLLDAERRNLGHYGFGIKGFVLSMIEVAIEVTEERVPARIIKEIIEAGQDMLQHPLELLTGAEQTIKHLAQDYTILLITKGDLLDQERKLAQSGLGPMFDGVEIISEKNTQAYQRIFSARNLTPDRVMMIGNSLKSDVIPPIEAGAWGTYIPHNFTWELERAEPPLTHSNYRECTSIDEIPALIETLEQQNLY